MRFGFCWNSFISYFTQNNFLIGCVDTFDRLVIRELAHRYLTEQFDQVKIT